MKKIIVCRLAVFQGEKQSKLCGLSSGCSKSRRKSRFPEDRVRT